MADNVFVPAGRSSLEAVDVIGDFYSWAELNFHGNPVVASGITPSGVLWAFSEGVSHTDPDDVLILPGRGNCTPPKGEMVYYLFLRLADGTYDNRYNWIPSRKEYWLSRVALDDDLPGLVDGSNYNDPGDPAFNKE